MSVCVVLNSSFEPLRPATMRRALRLVQDGKAEILQRDERRPVFSGDSSVDRPLVIRLKKYVNVPRVFRKSVSNTFLFARFTVGDFVPITVQIWNSPMKALFRL
jgi:hypothetical protein